MFWTPARCAWLHCYFPFFRLLKFQSHSFSQACLGFDCPVSSSHLAPAFLVPQFFFPRKHHGLHLEFKSHSISLETISFRFYSFKGLIVNQVIRNNFWSSNFRFQPQIILPWELVILWMLFLIFTTRCFYINLF